MNDGLAGRKRQGLNFDGGARGCTRAVWLDDEEEDTGHRGHMEEEEFQAAVAATPLLQLTRS